MRRTTKLLGSQVIVLTLMVMWVLNGGTGAWVIGMWILLAGHVVVLVREARRKPFFVDVERREGVEVRVYRRVGGGKLFPPEAAQHDVSPQGWRDDDPYITWAVITPDEAQDIGVVIGEAKEQAAVWNGERKPPEENDVDRLYRIARKLARR